MICIFCNSKMRLNDIDYNFKGNKDNYWVCDNCHATAFEKIKYIRYNKSKYLQFFPSEE